MNNEGPICIDWRTYARESAPPRAASSARCKGTTKQPYTDSPRRRPRCSQQRASLLLSPSGLSAAPAAPRGRGTPAKACLHAFAASAPCESSRVSCSEATAESLFTCLIFPLFPSLISGRAATRSHLQRSEAGAAAPMPAMRVMHLYLRGDKSRAVQVDPSPSPVTRSNSLLNANVKQCQSNQCNAAS